jgi:hypothetical protein
MLSVVLNNALRVNSEYYEYDLGESPMGKNEFSWIHLCNNWCG